MILFGGSRARREPGSRQGKTILFQGSFQRPGYMAAPSPDSAVDRHRAFARRQAFRGRPRVRAGPQSRGEVFEDLVRQAGLDGGDRILRVSQRAEPAWPCADRNTPSGAGRGDPSVQAVGPGGFRSLYAQDGPVNRAYRVRAGEASGLRRSAPPTDDGLGRCSRSSGSGSEGSVG